MIRTYAASIRLVTVACAIAAAVTSSRGVAKQSSSPIGSIFGQVVDAQTGQPIPGATVLLDDARPNNAGPRPVDEHAASPNSARPPDRIVVNSEGQFVFHNLSKSSYRLDAAASGYNNGSYGQSRPGGPRQTLELAENAHVSGVRIKLWRSASLSGHVVDEAGDPAVGVSVRAYHMSIEGTHRVTDFPTDGVTDDRGAYRLGSLSPGGYIVVIPQTSATVPLPVADALGTLRAQAAFDLAGELALSGTGSFAARMFRGVRVADFEVLQTESPLLAVAPLSSPTAPLLYRTVFFPAGSTTDEAGLVSIGPGEERAGIDLRLHASTGVRISGVANGPSGPARNLGLHLIPVNARGEPDALDAAQAITNEAGGFTFLSVTSGQYLLRMYRLLPSTHAGDRSPNPDRPLFADVPLTVGDRDIKGITVTLREGARVSGRLLFQGADAVTAQKLQEDTNVFLISLVSAEQSVPASGTVNGTFLTNATAPGRYVITAGPPPGWTLLSATREGRDLDDAPLELGTTDLDGVVVTLTNQPTHARVTVRPPDTVGTADLDATIVMFPANYAAWIEHGMARRRLRVTSPLSRNAAVAIDGLPPGDYIVAAAQGDVWSLPHTTALFDALARAGTRVTLTLGQTSAIDVTVRQIR
jgi:hypothetical protein